MKITFCKVATLVCTLMIALVLQSCGTCYDLFIEPDYYPRHYEYELYSYPPPPPPRRHYRYHRHYRGYGYNEKGVEPNNAKGDLAFADIKSSTLSVN